MIATADACRPLPDAWCQPLAAQLHPGETVLAWFEPDLDRQLRYQRGLVVLTERRILACDRLPGSEAAPALGAPADEPGHAGDDVWRSFPRYTVGEVRAEATTSAGLLELLASDRRLAWWRFTAGRTVAARRFVQLANSQDPLLSSGAAEQTVCPSCGGLVPADGSDCATCTAASEPPRPATLLRLARFAGPHLPATLLGLLLTLSATGAGLIPPYLTKPLMDRVLVPHQSGEAVDFGLVKWYLLGMAGAALLAWGLGWARSYVLAWVSERISANLRNTTYEHLQRLSLEFFGGKRTGDLVARLSSDTDRICNFLSLHLLDFITDLMMMALTAAILVWFDPLLALVTISPFPFIAWMVHRTRARLRRGFRSGGRAWGAMTSVLADTIPGIRVVKAFAQERREVERFRRANDRVLEANDRVNRLWAFFGPVVTLLTDSGLLVVWAFGVWSVVHSDLQVGTLTMFIAYITRFYGKVESLSYMVGATQRASASAQRIFEILDRQPSVPEPVRPVRPGRLRGEIELCDVRFQYGHRPVLQGVNLSIAPGEMIGLVGPSGAGKSTLVNLICRFYDVREGSIRVDGIDIRSFPLEEYRRNIGIVLQEPFLFYGTIAENIAYGRPDATRAEIIAAARAARAHDFILRLPDGYDSMVGERGQSLSGGERQRISIARALLIDPRILILDEATSSVDTETEREIQEALDNLVRGRTTIAIAHRLSTLRKADRLVVLVGGQVAEVGRHDELLKTSGTYARLHQAQVELAQGAA